MRHFLIAAFTLAAVVAVSPRPIRAAADAGPCLTSTAACTEWVTLGGGPAKSMVYRSHPLTVKNTGIHRAFIMVHGTNRNADHYFATANAAAFLAGATADTVVIAPHFVSSDRGCTDKLEPNEVSWSCTGDSWRSGGSSTSNPTLASFDFIDQILRLVSDKKTFPNMQAIVVAGHSAGGQFVTRYQMANKVHDTLGVPVSYVVANPSSYAWPDATRPLQEGDATPEAAAKGWDQQKVAPHTAFTYGPFDATKGSRMLDPTQAARPAPTYNKWPFGLEDRTVGYTKGISDEQLLKQLAGRPVTYLLSQVDTLPLGGFDSSANAMAQGATRRARGEAFVKYVNDKFHVNQPAIIIDECGHNDRCVYTTDVVFPVIFPGFKPAGAPAAR
jgi:pimeloyl-ACP methyl ester carboxylesterase